MARKVLLDFGAHHGQSIVTLASVLELDLSWEIEMYEPNPECFLSERMATATLPVNTHSDLIWTRDGELEFQQQNHRLANNHSPTDGRSDLDGWGSRAACLNTRHPALLPPIVVNCLDAAKLLDSFELNTQIVVKMDIEGAEFEVLRHVLRQGVASRIDLLFIEWHVRLMQDESMGSRSQIEHDLREAGVKLFPWQ